MSIFRRVLLTPGDTSIYSDKYFRFLTTTTHFFVANTTSCPDVLKRALVALQDHVSLPFKIYQQHWDI